MTSIDFEVDDLVGLITINNPVKCHAVSSSMARWSAVEGETAAYDRRCSSRGRPGLTETCAPVRLTSPWRRWLRLSH